jgi:hypothetical protein
MVMPFVRRLSELDDSATAMLSNSSLFARIDSWHRYRQQVFYYRSFLNRNLPRSLPLPLPFPLSNFSPLNGENESAP